MGIGYVRSEKQNIVNYVFRPEISKGLCPIEYIILAAAQVILTNVLIKGIVAPA